MSRMAFLCLLLVGLSGSVAAAGGSCISIDRGAVGRLQGGQCNLLVDHFQGAVGQTTFYGIAGWTDSGSFETLASGNLRNSRCSYADQRAALVNFFRNKLKAKCDQQALFEYRSPYESKDFKYIGPIQ